MDTVKHISTTDNVDKLNYLFNVFGSKSATDDAGKIYSAPSNCFTCSYTLLNQRRPYYAITAGVIVIWVRKAVYCQCLETFGSLD